MGLREVRMRPELERFLETGSVSHWCDEGYSQDFPTEELSGSQGSASS